MKLASKLPSIAAVHKFRTVWDKVGSLRMGQVNKKPLKWLRLGAQKWPIVAQVEIDFMQTFLLSPTDEEGELERTIDKFLKLFLINCHCLGDVESCKSYGSLRIILKARKSRCKAPNLPLNGAKNTAAETERERQREGKKGRDGAEWQETFIESP